MLFEQYNQSVLKSKLKFKAAFTKPRLTLLHFSKFLAQRWNALRVYDLGHPPPIKKVAFHVFCLLRSRSIDCEIVRLAAED